MGLEPGDTLKAVSSKQDDYSTFVNESISLMIKLSPVGAQSAIDLSHCSIMWYVSGTKASHRHRNMVSAGCFGWFNITSSLITTLPGHSLDRNLFRSPSLLHLLGAIFTFFSMFFIMTIE